MNDAIRTSRSNSLRRSPKTSELIARDLANHIIERDLDEGTVLPNERELIEIFGVGRTTLREALRLLETRGVITIRSGPRGGPVVRRPRPSDLGEALTLILQFEGASLADVLEARVALEPTIARLAARRITEEQVADLQKSVEVMADHVEDHEVFIAENRAFHTGVAEAAGSVVMRVFVDALKTIADGAVVGVEYQPKRRKAVAEAHQRIVDALATGDEDGAEAAMRSHLDEAGRFWTRRYTDLVERGVRWVH